VLDVEGVGEIGQLMIREAAYCVCAMYRGQLGEKWERLLWSRFSLEKCYDLAGTIIRAFPEYRYRVKI
jgi:hypothetical protein